MIESVSRETSQSKCGVSFVGRTPSPGRFFVPADSSLLAGLVGASPDGLLLDEEGTIEGIVEYKAPVFDLYDGIPAKYMAQVSLTLSVMFY